jgi:hypothetical protein
MATKPDSKKNAFWKKLVDGGVEEIDVGEGDEGDIDPQIWKYEQVVTMDLDARATPLPSFEVREQEIRKTVLLKRGRAYYRQERRHIRSTLQPE